MLLPYKFYFKIVGKSNLQILDTPNKFNKAFNYIHCQMMKIFKKIHSRTLILKL